MSCNQSGLNNNIQCSNWKCIRLTTKNSYEMCLDEICFFLKGTIVTLAFQEIASFNSTCLSGTALLDWTKWFLISKVFSLQQM